MADVVSDVEELVYRYYPGLDPRNEDDPPLFRMSPADAVRATGCARGWVMARIEEGSLRAVRVFNQWVILHEDLVAMLATELASQVDPVADTASESVDVSGL